MRAWRHVHSRYEEHQGTHHQLHRRLLAPHRQVHSSHMLRGWYSACLGCSQHHAEDCGAPYHPNCCPCCRNHMWLQQQRTTAGCRSNGWHDTGQFAGCMQASRSLGRLLAHGKLGQGGDACLHANSHCFSHPHIVSSIPSVLQPPVVVCCCSTGRPAGFHCVQHQ